MQYPFYIEGAPGEDGKTLFLDLPEGISSLQGLPRSTDMRGVEYQTYTMSKDFDTKEAMLAGAAEVTDAWIRMFLGVLYAKNPSAVEWRATPRYELAEKARKRKWRCQVYARFSLHGTIDEQAQAA